ncbi:MAG: hypothetical protein M0Z82_11475 [Actinomycetota bacterium]|jgi:hypothetical protein|nr:hypothetical protein [Actinomycetota bacterium]
MASARRAWHRGDQRGIEITAGDRLGRRPQLDARAGTPAADDRRRCDRPTGAGDRSDRRRRRVIQWRGDDATMEISHSPGDADEHLGATP